MKVRQKNKLNISLVRIIAIFLVAWGIWCLLLPGLLIFMG